MDIMGGNVMGEMAVLGRKLKDHRQGLIIWGALILSMMMVFVQRLCIGVMPEYLMEKFSIEITQLSTLTSATFYGYALFQIPSGILIDRIGIRRLNLAGAVLAFIGALMFSVADSYMVACIARWIIGMGSSVVITSLMKVQVLWFNPRYFSQLSAAMAFLSSLGSLAGTLPLALLIDCVGTQNTLYLIAGFNFLLIFLIFFFVKDKQKQVDSSLASLCSKSIRESVLEVLSKKGTYPPLLVGLFFISTTTSLTGLWVVNYLMKTYGMQKVQAAGYVLYFTLGFMAGSPIVSLVDRLLRGNYKKALNVFTSIYMLLWAYFIFICRAMPPLKQLPILFFVMGVVIMFHLLPFTAIKEVNAIENSGIATSMTNTMEFIGSGMLNFLIASLIQRGYSIGDSFVAIFVFSVLAFLSSLFVQWEK